MNDLERLEVKEAESYQKVKEWAIASNEDYTALDSYLAGLLALKQEIVDDFKESKDRAFAAHRAVCAQESAHLGAIDDTRKLGKRKLFEWTQAQEAERLKEQRRLEAEAVKLAEDDKLEAAAGLEKMGLKTEAESVLSAPLTITPVIVPRSVPKTKTKIAMIKRFEVLAPDRMPRELCSPDPMKIRARVLALGEAAAIPGVLKVWQEPS